jgi:hypothetical protein
LTAFQYQSVASIQDSKVVVHQTKWIVSDPLFHPEDYDSSEEGKAAMATAAFGDKVPEQGVFVLNASGDIIFSFDEEKEITVAQVTLRQFQHRPADPNVVYAYTVEHWGRAMFVDVIYKVEQPNKGVIMPRTSLLEQGTQEFPGNNFVLTMIGNQAEIKHLNQLPDMFIRVSNRVTAEDLYQPFRLKLNIEAIEKLNKDIVGGQLGSAIQAAIDWATEETGETDNWIIAQSQQPYGHEVARPYEQIRTEVGCQVLQQMLNDGRNRLFGPRAQFQVDQEGGHVAMFNITDNTSFSSYAPKQYHTLTTETTVRSANAGNYIGKVRIYNKEYWYLVRANIQQPGSNQFDFMSNEIAVRHQYLASYDLDQESFVNTIALAAQRELPFLTRENFEILTIEKVPLLTVPKNGLLTPYDSI